MDLLPSLARHGYPMYATGPEEIAALKAVIEKGKFFRYEPGSETEQFEGEWAALMGARHCLAVNSGTSALICALSGLGIGRGDEVIVPGYTFIATAAAVLAVGAIPILAEVDETLTLDPDSVRENLSPFTRAIIPVHMAGRPCDMERLLALAGEKGLAVVEDACQALGGSYRGSRLGTLGNAGAYSFNFYKILAAGEGGAMVTDNGELFSRARFKSDCGYSLLSGKDAEVDEFVGQNFRAGELQSAMIRVQQKRLAGILWDLRQEQSWFRRRLAGLLPLAPSNDEGGDCATQLVLQFPEASQARDFLRVSKEAGLPPMGSPLDTGKHVYSNWTGIMERRGGHPGGHNPWQDAPRRVEYHPAMLPNTLEHLGRSVYLGMHPRHSHDDWERWGDGFERVSRKIGLGRHSFALSGI